MADPEAKAYIRERGRVSIQQLHPSQNDCVTAVVSSE